MVNVVSKGEKKNFSQSQSFTINNHSNDHDICEAFLRNVDGNYQYLIRGKNGEPKRCVLINFDFYHNFYQGSKSAVLKTDKEGIHVNFSGEFAQGEGPNGLMGRLGQVVYTATSQDPQAKVWINVEGKPLELLGQGDGLIVDQPITRKSFQENYQL
jgi:hypothetical protein